jgi:hypothetical protein
MNHVSPDRFAAYLNNGPLPPEAKTNGFFRFEVRQNAARNRYFPDPSPGGRVDKTGLEDCKGAFQSALPLAAVIRGLEHWVKTKTAPPGLGAALLTEWAVKTCLFQRWETLTEMIVHANPEGIHFGPVPA